MSYDKLNAPVIGIIGGSVERQMDYPGQTAQKWTMNYVAQGDEYSRYIESNGMVPTIIPSTNQARTLLQLMQRVDGLLFAGGGHLPAQSYNQSTSHIPETVKRVMPEDHRRFLAEATLMRLAEMNNTPVLGICRGAQIMNIIHGGTLVQSLTNHPDYGEQHMGELGPDWFNHRHNLHILGDARRASAVRESVFQVNSMHDQGILELGKGIEVQAVSTDSTPLPEWIIYTTDGGIEHESVQWHPEHMPPDDPLSILLANNLSAAAANYSRPEFTTNDVKYWQSYIDGLDLQLRTA